MIEAVRGIFAGGDWMRASRGATITVTDPALEETIATVPRGAAADARTCVHAARWAFDEGPWPRMTPAERAAHLKRFAVEATIDRPAFVELAVREWGVPVAGADEGFVRPSLEAFAWYAERASRDPESRLPDHGDTSSTVVREPAGVVAVLAAAAEPLAAIVHKAIPALAAGNTVVVKAASAAPLSAFALARCAQRAGMPPGVFNVVSGSARDAGDELASNAMVDVVALAGSIATGRRVAARAAGTVKTCLFTLGASGTAVVLDGSDPAVVAPSLVAAWLARAGQTWGAPCRLVVTAAVHDQLLDAIVAEVKGMPVGDPADPSIRVGPVRAAKARDRAEALIGAAVAAGASLVAGGSRPGDLSRGFFLEPAVVTGVRPGMGVFGEEVAAPVLAVVAAGGDEDAIRIANERIDGVSAMVWSEGRDRALAAARRLRAGTVLAQGAGANPWAPAGGYGQAGVGRERGLAGMDAYSEIKHVAGPAT
ncbi:MAG TPA: aldehyde dehydrogenase family protein [Actinomycetota bacterium]|nr:aldehyde dehydrogenase family protein [Actinomycetota bacterium]